MRNGRRGRGRGRRRGAEIKKYGKNVPKTKSDGIGEVCQELLLRSRRTRLKFGVWKLLRWSGWLSRK